MAAISKEIEEFCRQLNYNEDDKNLIKFAIVFIREKQKHIEDGKLVKGIGFLFDILESNREDSLRMCQLVLGSDNSYEYFDVKQYRNAMKRFHSDVNTVVESNIEASKLLNNIKEVWGNKFNGILPKAEKDSSHYSKAKESKENLFPNANRNFYNELSKINSKEASASRKLFRENIELRCYNDCTKGKKEDFLTLVNKSMNTESVECLLDYYKFNHQKTEFEIRQNPEKREHISKLIPVLEEVFEAKQYIIRNRAREEALKCNKKENGHDFFYKKDTDYKSSINEFLKKEMDSYNKKDNKPRHK